MNRILEQRRPVSSRAVVTTLLWISRTLASLIVAGPVLFAIQASGVASGPERDAVLFRPGALLLLELARSGAPLLGAAFKGTALLCGLCLVLGLLPLGAAFDLLARDETNAFASRFARSVGVFPRFLALGATALLAQAALLLASSLLGSAVAAALHGSDQRWISVAPIAAVALGLLGCAWIGAALDVARGALVRGQLSAREALFSSLLVLREAPLSVLVGSYPSAAGSAFACASAAWLMARIDVSGPSVRNIALAFAVHQLSILLGIALRVRWLAAALELSAEQGRASAGH